MLRLHYVIAATGLALTAGLFGAKPALAQSPAVIFTTNAVGEELSAGEVGAPSFAFGFAFGADTNSSVTSLGYYFDPSFNPSAPTKSLINLVPTPTGPFTYADSHEVGLYDISGGSGNLLAETTITSTSSQNGDFLYNSISPVSLVAGDEYFIEGISGEDDPLITDVTDPAGPSGNGFIINPSIVPLAVLEAPSTTLTLTGLTSSDGPVFGPNFLLSPSDATDTPEPSGLVTITAFLAMTAGFGFMRSRKLSNSVSK